MKYYSDLQERQEGDPEEIQAGQPHLVLWDGEEAENPGNHFQAHE